MAKNRDYLPGEKSGLWFSRLGQAILDSFLATTIAVSIGLALTLWLGPKLASESPKWALVLEHVGLGFIVAGLSVFAYETGAHMKGVVDLSTILARSIEERVAPIAQAVGEAALSRALRELLVGDNEIKPYVAKAITQCKDLVIALSNLEKSGIWAHEQYVEFVSYLLGYVVQNAKALQSLGHPEQPGQYFYTMPTSTAASAIILTNQMKALMPGDCYDVLSDLTSWKDEQLKGFLNSTDLVIRNQGVKVVRIFNLCHAHSKGLQRIKALQILTDHLDHSSQLGVINASHRRYEVLIITEIELGKENDEEYRERIRQAHFGIFTRKIDNLKLRVEVKMPDLSHMVLTNNHEEVARDYDLFTRARVIAKPLTNVEEIEKFLDQAGLK